MKHVPGRFRALGNLGEVLSRLGRLDEAVSAHTQRLSLARSPAMKDRASEAAAFGALGSCHRLARQFDKALGYHTQVRTLIFIK